MRIRPYFLQNPGEPFPGYGPPKNYVPPKGESIIQKTKNIGSAIKKDVLQIESTPKDYKSNWIDSQNKSYKKWLKTNYPNEYYKKYGGKIKDTIQFKKPPNPWKNLTTVGKVVRFGGYAGIASAVYEGIKYAFGTGNIPNDIEEREMHRKAIFESALSTITYNDKGEAVQTIPDYKKIRELMKDHMPYKKYMERPPSERNPNIYEKRRTVRPTNPNFKPQDNKETEGLDFIWVDPMDSMWGDASHSPDFDNYKLTEFGYVRKGS